VFFGAFNHRLLVVFSTLTLILFGYGFYEGKKVKSLVKRLKLGEHRNVRLGDEEPAVGTTGNGRYSASAGQPGISALGIAPWSALWRVGSGASIAE
jgi:hypothetical protein